MNKGSEQVETLSPEERRELLSRMLKRREAPHKTAPLSFVQERFWFFDQLDPGSPLYNMFLAVRLTGALDKPILEHSLNQVIQRHESLRTTFAVVDGTPVQVISPALQVRFVHVDFQDADAAEREALAQARADAEVQRRFDLAHGPLLRATLLQLAAEEHVLVLTLHHIIADAWSMGVLVREMTAAYHALVNQTPLSLPDLSLQYAEYASWQRDRLGGDRVSQALAYWKQQLAAPLPVLEMLTRESPVESPELVRRELTFSPELTAALKTFSGEQGVTLFVTLLAAFKTLLFRYTGQTDILVGSPIANRDRAELEAMIGPFIDTLVFRSDLSGNPTFADLLQQVKKVVLDAFSHQDIPFRRLVDELHPTRDLKRNPIFQTVFVMQPPPPASVTLPGLTIAPFSIHAGSDGEAPDTIGISIHDTAQGLKAVVDYQDTLINQGVLEQFQVFLESVLRNPHLRLQDIPLLSEAEHRRVLSWSRSPSLAYPRERTLTALFEEQAARVPDNVAVACGDARLTYRELNCRANQLAHALRCRGIGANDLVGLCVERSTEMVVGLLGILKAGAAYLPLDPTYPPERLAYMADHAGVAALLTQSQLLPGIPAGWQDRILCLDTDWESIAQKDPHNPTFATLADSLMYVIYTSGSTGQPKGAGVYKHSFVNLMHWYIREFGLTADDSALVISSMSFDLTQKNFYGPLLVGGTLHLLPTRFYDPQEILDIIATQKVTWVNCTPSAFHPLVAYAASQDFAALDSLRYVFLGGEQVVLSHLWPWLRSGHCRTKLVNTYGPTECTDLCLSCRLEDPAAFQGPILPLGKPLYNAQVLLLDAALNPVPVGVLGEVYIGGEGVGQGYVNDARATAAKFFPNPYGEAPGERIYKTGDLAYYLPDGKVLFTGRSDYQVKFHGYRIELGEIEMALRQHASVQEAVVQLHRDAQDQDIMVAYVVPQPGNADLRSEDLRAHLHHCLPDFMVPAAFVLMRAFPLTLNGKLDRNALRPPEIITASPDADFVPPEGPVEEKLAAIWSALLNVERIGAYDDFFELGGNSLLATQVVYQVNQAFQIQLSVRSIFEEPALAGLALVIEEQLLEELGEPGEDLPAGE